MCNSPHIARIAVVLPAPSGPIRPNISPRSTVNETSLSAVVVPNFLTTWVNSIADIECHLRFDRHALLQHAVLVVDVDAHAVDELRALLRRLHIARSEFSFRRDVANRARNAW